MEAKQRDELINGLVSRVITTGPPPVRSVPLKVKDTLTFILTNELIQTQSSVINGAAVEWQAVMSQEGDAIGITQLLRRRNGLPLQGATGEERLKSFLSLFDENDTLKLQIVDIRERMFANIDDEGQERKSTSYYYVFKVV